MTDTMSMTVADLDTSAGGVTVYVGAPMTLDDVDPAQAALVASAIPASPPKAWFRRDDVPAGAPLTFTDEGRVYGLLAPANVAHIGMPGQKTFAPKSPSGYSYFHTGEVRCEDGSRVATGRLTMLTGHEPDDRAGAKTAAAHYDNTGTAVADVVAWDSPEGVMCAGAARPGLTPEQLRMAMASPASGDWRPVNGKHDMVAALLVNVPGFPVTRSAMAASGELLSLIASAGNHPVLSIPQETPVTDTANTVTETATEEPVTAAAAPSFAKDQVVTLPAALPPGMVASIEGDYAVVSVEVPLGELADAGPDGRRALSASARERLMESQVVAMQQLRDEAAALVASAADKQRGAAVLADLADVPGATS